MSYRLRIDGKSRKTARFVGRIQRAIQKAFISSGKTQQEVAEILGVDRSVVNRRLKHHANLTARSIAELAFALDKDIVFELVDKNTLKPTMGFATYSTVEKVVSLNDYKDSVTSGTATPAGTVSIESAVL